MGIYKLQFLLREYCSQKSWATYFFELLIIKKYVSVPRKHNLENRFNISKYYLPTRTAVGSNLLLEAIEKLQSGIEVCSFGQCPRRFYLKVL